MLLGHDGRPLAETYAACIAIALGMPNKTGYLYEPPGARQLDKGARFVPSVYGFPTNFKVFSRHSKLDVYLEDVPGFEEPQLSVTMIGDPWGLEDLETIMRACHELKWGHLVVKTILEEADFLDANPMYRNLPKVADRHLDPKAERAAVKRPMFAGMEG